MTEPQSSRPQPTLASLPVNDRHTRRLIDVLASTKGTPESRALDVRDRLEARLGELRARLVAAQQPSWQRRQWQRIYHSELLKAFVIGLLVFGGSALLLISVLLLGE